MTHSGVGVAVSKISVTMSSRDISDLTGKQHKDVLHDCRKMFEALNIQSADFSADYKDSIGRMYQEYLLDEDLTMTLVMGYSIPLRHKVAQRWRELEHKTQVPQSLPEALRLAADLAEEKQKLESQLAIAAPKAVFVDRYVEATGSMSFRQVCKLLQAKETDFRLFLIEKQVMYRLGGLLYPYAHHLDAGRFEVKTGTSQVNNHNFSQTRFTSKGVQWVGGLWIDHLRQEGAA